MCIHQKIRLIFKYQNQDYQDGRISLRSMFLVIKINDETICQYVVSKINRMLSKDKSEFNNLNWLGKKLSKLFVSNQQNAVKIPFFLVERCTPPPPFFHILNLLLLTKIVRKWKCLGQFRREKRRDVHLGLKEKYREMNTSWW